MEESISPVLRADVQREEALVEAPILAITEVAKGQQNPAFGAVREGQFQISDDLHGLDILMDPIDWEGQRDLGDDQPGLTVGDTQNVSLLVVAANTEQDYVAKVSRKRSKERTPMEKDRVSKKKKPDKAGKKKSSKGKEVEEAEAGRVFESKLAPEDGHNFSFS